MIFVEFEDDQYGDLMKDIECFEEVAEKAKKVVKKISHAIGENSMSMRGRQQYPRESYDRGMGYRGMGMRGYEEEDSQSQKYDRRYM